MFAFANGILPKAKWKSNCKPRYHKQPLMCDCINAGAGNLHIDWKQQSQWFIQNLIDLQRKYHTN